MIKRRMSMKMRKIISLLLVAVMMVFAIPQYGTKAEAATTNYARAMAEYQTVINVTEQGIDATGNKDCGAQLTLLARVLARAPREATTPIVLYFPSGKYKLSSSIKIYATNVHIVAENDSVFTASKAIKGMLEIRDTSNVTVLGGKWDGNNKAKYGIQLSNAKDVTINECVVTRAAERGIHAIASTAKLYGIKSYKNKKYGVSDSNGADITIMNSSIYQNSMHGICVTDSVVHMENGNNKVYKNGYSGISVTGKKGKIYVSGNEFTQNGYANDSRGHGVAISDKSYGEVTNNVISKNKQCGISLTNKVQAIVTNNKITNNGRHGIGSASGNIFTAENNTITGNKWHGIMIRDKGTGTIINNVLNKNSVSGLSVEKTSGTVTVTGNTVYGNKSNGIIVTKGTMSLTNNTITKNKAFGIYTDNAKVTLVSGNVIKSNSKGDIDAASSKVKIGKDNTVKKVIR
jgi:parallel beta-helix repeat protein